MNKLLGAVFKEDGSMADSIPRSALGLPGIQSFVAIAQEGAAKPEVEDMDVDSLLQFPTNEDVVIGACMCGDGCECPSCATHGNAPATGDSQPAHGSSCCGEGCKSSLDCADHLSLPKGITSIDHLLSFAAANVPHPASRRTTDLQAHARDTTILPSAVHVSEDAARLHGITQLKPLECCNGRCQCPPGECSCDGECCGCCMHCNCDDGADGDGDTKMAEDGDGTSATVANGGGGGCCSSKAATAANNADHLQPSPTSSPQESSRRPSIVTTHSRSVSPLAGLDIHSLSSVSPIKSIHDPHSGASTPLQSPSTLAPGGNTSRGHSPRPSISSNTGIWRTASSSRRSTTTQANGIQRSASTGKAASKALALHTPANHPHPQQPRLILPKNNGAGANGGGGGKSCCGGKSANWDEQNQAQNQQNQSFADTSSLAPSVQNSQHVSPAFGPVQYPADLSHMFGNMPDSFQNATSDFSIPSLSSLSPGMDATGAQGQGGGGQAADLGNEPGLTDEEIMAMIEQLGASSNMPFDDPMNNVGAFNNFLGAGQKEMGMDPSFVMGSGLNGDLAQQPPSAAGHHPGQQPQPPPQQQQSSSSSSSYQGHSDTPQQASGLGGTTLEQWAVPPPRPEPEPVFEHLPLQSTAFLQQLFASNPSFAIGLANGGVGGEPAQAAPNGPNGPNGPSASTAPNVDSSSSSKSANPNVIDLSKPLNASDVERIMRALQEQQARLSQAEQGQGQGQNQAPSHAPSHVAPPTTPSSAPTITLPQGQGQSGPAVSGQSHHLPSFDSHTPIVGTNVNPFHNSFSTCPLVAESAASASAGSTPGQGSTAYHNYNLNKVIASINSPAGAGVGAGPGVLGQPPRNSPNNFDELPPSARGPQLEDSKRLYYSIMARSTGI